MKHAEANHKSIVGWFAGNAVAANLLMICALIAGVVGFVRMERVVFPGGGWNGASVSVSWPGAAPQEVEQQIIVRIEEAIADLEGIEEVTATAREGNGSVNIEANRSVDMNEFVDDLKLRIDSINNLPPSAFRPQVQQWRAQNIYMGVALHGSIDLLELKRLADEVRRDMAQLPGGSRATVWATLSEEVAIEVSEEQLRRYDLTFDEVAQAVRGASVNSSSGNVRTAVGDVQLRARSLADTKAEFEDIVLRQSAEGGIVRVGDVATVIDGFVDANLISTFDGEPMALIAIPTLETNMNVVRTQKAVLEYLEMKNAELPPGVQLSMWWDDSKIYFDRVRTITSSATIGLALVFLVLILFLRPAVALWCSVGIGVAFAATFSVLPLVGVSLNMLSLFAFLLVIGIVVDDAIIVGENIHNMVERGEKGLDAAVLGTQLVAKPVVFAVITTMMAFAPWMLLSGPEVQFTRQISLVVIVALTFSLIESLLILPNHLAHLKPVKQTSGPFAPLLRFQQRFADGLVWVARSLYRPLLGLAIRARYLTLSIFVAALVLSLSAWLVGGFVKFRFMPEVENETVQIDIEMPEGTPFARVEQIRAQVEAAEERFLEGIRRDFGDADLIENVAMITSDGEVESWITLTPPETRPEGLTMRIIAERLREEIGPIPDAEEYKIDFTINDEQGGVWLALQSSDFDALRRAADDLKRQLSTYEDVSGVRDDMQSAADEARISLKPGAEALGLTLADVTRQVRQAFYGEEVQRLPRDGDDVRVMVRYPKEARESLDAVTNYLIRTADGREVPFAAVATIEYAPGVNRISRRGRERAVYVGGDVRGDSTGDIYKDLNDNFFEEFDRRHPEVTRVSVGAQQGEQEFLAEIQTLQLLMLGGMYVLLAVAFRSVFQPLLVMTAIPFALTGAILGHLIMGVPIALFSFFGIGAAAGVVINDNLVLIDYVNRLRAQGVGAYQALLEAGTARFRPILLTSVTTFVGIMPMMAERSTQAQFLKPMVISLGFAIVFALTLTLVLVPALYAIGADVARYTRFALFGTPFRKVGSTYDDDFEGDMGVHGGDEVLHGPGGRLAQPAE